MGVFYNRFSLDKKILKSKGSMQGSALFSRFFHFSSVVLCKVKLVPRVLKIFVAFCHQFYINIFTGKLTQ